jgi:hypothetical protein
MNTAADFIHLVDASVEAADVDFKSHIDISVEGNWLEIMKDIVAMVNSGGGAILFGINDDGTPASFDCQPLLDFDTSKITAKIRSRTGIDLPNLILVAAQRGGHGIAVLAVGGSEFPVGFTKDGQYEISGQQKFAFRQGQFFFRHGAKSEPGTTNDIRESIERRLATVREEWLGNIRAVVEAPQGSHVSVIPPSGARTIGAPGAIRIVTEESADVARLVHSDDSHPLRQCDVIREVNKLLSPEISINQGHIQDIRRIHRIDNRANFRHKGRIPGAPTQYSQAFVEWIVESYKKDNSFFDKTREARKALTATRSDFRSGLSNANEPVLAL